MVENLREETELRLLMTAAVTDKPDIREKILDFAYFTTPQAKKAQEVFIDIFLKDPNADYSVMMSALPRNEQIAFIELMNTTISMNIEEMSVDGALKNLRETQREDSLKRMVYDLIVSDNYTADDLRAIADEAEKSDTEHIDSAAAYIDDYDTPVETVPTGFTRLDKLLGGGLTRGTVSAIGARPSVGKTTFAVNIARYNSGRRVLFFSLEMSARMVYDKLISDVGNLDYADCVKHKVNLDTVKSVLKKYDKLTVIDDVYEIEDIASIIRREKPELVIIDYIQIVQSRKEIDILRQRIDYIASVIKRTAKQTKAHIMCLSQINRGAKEDPTMSALKESGGLEETGDYVLILKRPYVLDKSDERLKPEDTELKIDKNKFGESGLLEYYFDGGHQRFLEVGFMSEKKHGHEKTEQIARMKNGVSDEQEGINEDLPF